MVDVGRKVGDLFGQLGVPAEVLQGRLGELAKTSLSRLQNLKVAFGAAALETNKFGKATNDGRANIPPFAWNPAPAHAREDRAAFLRGTYFIPPGQANAENDDPFPGLMNARTKRRTELMILLMNEPSVRTAFEKIAGGKVVVDHRMDGKVSMLDASSSSGMATSALTGASGPSAPPNMYKFLMAMDQAVMDEAQKMRPGASQFWELDVGVGSLLGGDEDRYESEEDDEDQEAGDFPSVARRGLGAADLLQPKSQGGESVDTGTLRLKRLLDKRDQMYDIYNKVYDKYNQSARQAIDNMRG